MSQNCLIIDMKMFFVGGRGGILARCLVKPGRVGAAGDYPALCSSRAPREEKGKRKGKQLQRKDEDTEEESQ